MEFIDILRIVLILGFIGYIVVPAAISSFKQEQNGKALGCLIIPLLLIALIVSDSFKKNDKNSFNNNPSNYTINNSGRYYCKDLTSSEASHLLRNGHYYLDADNDGFPCE